MFIGAFWLTAFVKQASKAPLQFEDVYRLHPVFGARVSTDRLESATNMYYTRAIEKIRASGKDENAANSPTSSLTVKETALKWALMKGILHAERRKMQAKIQSPLAYGMAVALFVVQMVQALGWNNSQYVMKGASMSIFAGLLSMVYRKAFRLGTKGRALYPTGVIMNLIASDCTAIQSMLQFITDIICVPFEIFSLSVIIIVFAGPAGAAGLSFMICCTGISILIVSKSYSVEHKALAATDERVKVTGEVINGIKIVKFFAWETPFIERLSLLRENELAQHLRLRMIEASFSVILNCVPAFTNVLVFSVYRGLGNNVDAATVFATLSVINLIRLPIAIVAMVAQGLFTALASLERLAKFFAVEEMDMDRLIELPTGSENAILFENASFEWSSEKPIEIEDDSDFKKSDDQTLNAQSNQLEAFKGPFTLRNINLEIKAGSLTMIVGKVGSGKSSLLGALIGDMSATDGCIKVSGRFGYSPQASWLQNTTLRANILLGTAFDEARYNETIRCCGLSKDLAILPFGDMSDIGEKGITLSGGQAARVNLARAIYSNADIMLMDDPLAAVDAHVGKQILDECILGVCKAKTVVLVTHQLHIASQADHIVVMSNGEISEQGSFSQLMNARGGFFDLMQEYGHSSDDAEALQADEAIKETPAVVPINELKEFDLKGTDLNEEEEREVGSVALKYYVF
ncbi:Canalicular multispecific organic anion transporter 2 [Chytriomyces hyalinus]|nr:Canalicular multispecific organic anion transporter 2 [Chytriomyces hyalinus]